MSENGLYYIMGGVQGGSKIKECIVSLSERCRENAKILYIGAAHGNDPTYERGFTNSVKDTRLELDVLHLSEEDEHSADEQRISTAFGNADIIFFDGGEVSALGKVFERYKLQDLCKAAFERGASVGGLCAGGSYFASTVIHTSLEDDGALYVDPGLGLIPDSAMTCYIGDRAQIQRLRTLENVSYQRNETGVGVPINQVVTWEPEQGYKKLLDDALGPIIYTPD